MITNVIKTFKILCYKQVTGNREGYLIITILFYDNFFALNLINLIISATENCLKLQYLRNSSTNVDMTTNKRSRSGAEPHRNRIWCMSYLEYDIWWQQF